jgi:hypothetical protein
MITIHRPAPDEVNGQTGKVYAVGMAGARYATLCVCVCVCVCLKPQTKSPIWRQIALVPEPAVDYVLKE